MTNEEDWKATDIFGVEHDARKTPQDGPSEAWVRGWDTGVGRNNDGNPYSEYTLEWHDWQDGYETGMEAK